MLEEVVGNDICVFFDKGVGLSKCVWGIFYGEGEFGKMSKMLCN